jgi:hypothetical protein
MYGGASMRKIAFLGNGETPARLLQLFSRMTPGCHGIWQDLQGVEDVSEADYVVAIDRFPARPDVPVSKRILLGAHPEGVINHNAMHGEEAFKIVSMANTFGFGEWWIKHDYDYLSRLEPPFKTAQLGAIVSDSNTVSAHRLRRAFLERFCRYHPGVLDLYGRIKPWGALTSYYCGPLGQASSSGGQYWFGKEPVYKRYRYMLEFDVVGEHYFSERVFDCLLLWALPIYSGGAGISRYLPEESFRRLVLTGNGDEVAEWAKDDTCYVSSLPAIAEARDILLNKLQLWPRVKSILDD